MNTLPGLITPAKPVPQMARIMPGPGTPPRHGTTVLRIDDTTSQVVETVVLRLPPSVPELLAIVGMRSDYTGFGAKLFSKGGLWIPVEQPDTYDGWARAVAYLMVSLNESGDKQ